MAIYGYARVSSLLQSTKGNSIEEQVGELKKYGCDFIVTEAYSGKTMDRPKFNQLMEQLQKGDTLVVCKLDRFSRTLIQGVKTIQNLFERGITINILNLGVIKQNDLCSSLIIKVMLCFAEYEKGLIIERTMASKKLLKSDPNSNFKEGRPKKFSDLQINYALSLLDNGHSYNEVSKITSISKSTLIRAHKLKQNISESEK